MRRSLLALLFLQPGPPHWSAAGAPDSCPAGGGGGPGCPAARGSDDRFTCIKWRQTGSCDPKGPREPRGDKGCEEIIQAGSSGYCQCGVSGKLKAREVTCDHRPFKCSTECLQFPRYTCVGWRQTGDCSSDGPRQEDRDKGCDDSIDARMSGYCECGDGRIIRKPGCDAGEFLEPFKCRDECAMESDLYEELGIDSGVSDKALKQAFRKLSLKYHPDKTKNDPVLTARFVAIREAYDIISDPEQRALYDAAGLKMVNEAKNQKIQKGPASSAEIPVSLEALYNGEELSRSIGRKVICRGCAERYTDRCKKCRAQCANEIQLRNVQMGPMVMQQQVEVASKQKCRVQNVPIVVTVERGMATGNQITFKGMGEQQPNKIPGDVVMTLKQTPHKIFRRKGSDLHMEMDISVREALLGFERSLTHLDGRTISFVVDGVTKPFGVLRIAGEGMPLKGDPTQHGDLYVKFRFVMPKDGREWLQENCPQASA